MSDEQINIVGFIILAVLFWYIQIYRPRKKLLTPGELLLKPIMSSDDKKMYDAIQDVFPHPYIATGNVSLDELIFSPEMNKKGHFHKAMRQQKISWLIVDADLTPLLAIDYSTNDDDMKLNYLSHAGIGCCVFATSTTKEDMINTLSEAASTIKGIQDSTTPITDSPLNA